MQNSLNRSSKPPLHTSNKKEQRQSNVSKEELREELKEEESSNHKGRLNLFGSEDLNTPLESGYQDGNTEEIH
jgi:hypothetical protein